MNSQQLTQLLTEAGIDASQYGTGKAKTLDHLLREIGEGETVLETIDGKLHRRIALVSVTVLSSGGQRLLEDRQEFNDGRVRRRGLDAIAEKHKPGENPTEAARRALVEELQFDSELVAGLAFTVTATKQDVKTSESFPGLATIYDVTELSVQIPDDLFCAEGYVENQSDKSTFFVWGS